MIGKNYFLTCRFQLLVLRHYISDPFTSHSLPEVLDGHSLVSNQVPLDWSWGFSKCSPSHRLHVWYIYLHLVNFYGKCRKFYHTWILWASKKWKGFRPGSLNVCRSFKGLGWFSGHPQLFVVLCWKEREAPAISKLSLQRTPTFQRNSGGNKSVHGSLGWFHISWPLLVFFPFPFAATRGETEGPSWHHRGGMLPMRTGNGGDWQVCGGPCIRRQGGGGPWHQGREVMGNLWWMNLWRGGFEIDLCEV